MTRQPLNDRFLRTSFLSGANAAYVEEMQAQYERNPGSVGDEWRHFFESLNEEREKIPGDGRGPSWGREIETENGELVAALTGDYGAEERNLRDNLQQEKEVTARLEGVDLGTGVAAVQKAVADMHLPPSIRVEYGGTYKEQQKSFHDLVIVLLLALVLIFLVLLFEFRSYTAPVAILSSAVLSTSGVFFALLITRTTFNVSSFMGLIMVVGIVAKNGILLLDANQKFLAFGFEPEEAMIQAGRRRLRPIVMTAMAAVAGMFPLALALGAGSQMLQPLAIAVIGGILISMVLSLIITPAMQYYLTRSR